MRTSAVLFGVLLLAGPTAAAAQDLPANSSRKPFERLFAGRQILSVPAAALRFSVQEAAKPPQPEHTGLQALVRSTGSDFKAFPRRKSTWVILGIGAAAAGLALPVDDEVTDTLHDSSARKFFAPGRVVGQVYFQAGTAVATYVLGRYVIKPGGRKSNRVTHVGFDLLRAIVVSQTFTLALKYAVRRDRPTGECCAFPSGHASATFASAAVLERHFGYRSAWPTFAIAGYVAASRLFDNRHFLSDVLFGSALGIASGWTVVGRHGRDQFALAPVPVRKGVALMATWRPAVSRTASHP